MDAVTVVFNKLKELLQSCDLKDKKNINVFSAAGMNHYEVKHSKFLAWLLDPSNPHNFNDFVLKKFCNLLLEYKTNVKDSNIKILSNKTILLGKDFSQNKDDLQEKKLIDGFLTLLNGEVTVSTEQPLDSDELTEQGKKKKRYIDILIEIKSQNTKTVIVIENKVETTTHSNQLCAYDEWVHKQGYDKEIFVLLSPNGELPRNFGGNNQYNEKWCVFDYKKVNEIVEELLKKVNENQMPQKNKLRILLEDYMKLVNNEVLGESKETMKLCRSIYFNNQKTLFVAAKNLQEYFNKLDSYIGYCNTKIQELIDRAPTAVAKCNVEIAEREELSKAVIFYTSGMQDVFAKYNDVISVRNFRWYFGFDGPQLVCYLALPPKNKDGVIWSPAQQKLIEYKNGGKSPMKPPKYEVKLFSKILLNIEQMEKSFNEVQGILDDTLDVCLNQVGEFERKFKKEAKTD